MVTHWLCLILLQVSAAVVNGGSFSINSDQFMKDGEPFNLRSGSLHYFRVPPPYWRDRMQRMKAIGLNGVTAYVAWNFHEEKEGFYTGLSLVTDFLDIARSEGMVVVLRPGPYICGEWEFGGLPAWLLWDDKPGLKLRTNEPQYMAAAEKWLRVLYEKLRSYTYSRGGPIVMVQIENEYGSFGNCELNPSDSQYMNILLNLAMEYFGTGVVYSTIDGGEGATAAGLGQGSPWRGDARVLATVDGALSSSDAYAQAFQRQKDFNAPGNSPRMWMELWVGWFTVWLDAMAANKTAAEFGNGVGNMISENASFSLYMAHGGTNLGFWSGANGDQGQSYTPDITSYDYSAPISEGGDHNIGSDGGDLFNGVRGAIAAKFGQPGFQEPTPIARAAYGKVMLGETADLFSNLGSLSSCNHRVTGAKLPSFEELRHNYGLLLYSSVGHFWSMDLNISAQAAHDRVQVFVDGNEIGTAYRPQCPTQIEIPAGNRMDLLVENMGRINYGSGSSMYDYKGYLAPPPVAGVWSAVCLPLRYEQVSTLPFWAAPAAEVVGGGKTSPVFKKGKLFIAGTPADTWLDMEGFSKGYVWVNGINIGRFWEPAGPQHTLYLPAPYLNPGDNEVIVLDLHHSLATSLQSVASPRYQQPQTTTTNMYI